MQTGLLALNAGSSSLKFALYPADGGDDAGLSGRIERLDTPRAVLVERRDPDSHGQEHGLGFVDHHGALTCVLERCEALIGTGKIAAVGHRVVHSGPELVGPVRVDDEVIEKLDRMCPYDPAHQMPAVAQIREIAARWPGLRQVACFDTTFHAGLPAPARMLPISREYAQRGLHRYGFHGLSYTYLLDELRRINPVGGTMGRVVLAHLGNGSSLAAVQGNRCVDTTMGFTPNSGLPMSTRSGELDPGVMLWLAREAQLTVEQIFDLANRGSGLLGISGTSGDIRDLLNAEHREPSAAAAIALFCHYVKKAIGALSAVLGGIDTLVFSGGIGEHAAPIRERVCAGLGFLGLEIDPGANAENAAIISRSNSRVTVRVIATNEEIVIARETRRVLQAQSQTVAGT